MFLKQNENIDIALFPKINESTKRVCGPRWKMFHGPWFGLLSVTLQSTTTRFN